MDKKKFGIKLRQAREYKSDLINKKYTGQMLANDLGVSRGYIGDLESGRRHIPNPMLKKIIQICQVPPDFFDIEAKEISLSSIPIIGTIRAGQPILAIENIEYRMDLPKWMFSSDKQYFGLTVIGDSMNLEFCEGTVLIIEKTSYVDNGDIGIVLIDNLDATVKKITINKDIIKLSPMSTNLKYKPQLYNLNIQEVTIIGKVKYSIKSY